MWLYSWFGTDFLLKGNLRKPPFARSSEPWHSITQFFTHWQKFFRDMKLIVLTENTVRETSDASRAATSSLYWCSWLRYLVWRVFVRLSRLRRASRKGFTISASSRLSVVPPSLVWIWWMRHRSGAFCCALLIRQWHAWQCGFETARETRNAR